MVHALWSADYTRRKLPFIEGALVLDGNHNTVRNVAVQKPSRVSGNHNDASGAAFAAPSASQVERAMAQGNWQQADAELSQVLAEHPNNAHAHYLYGQVLANEGRFADALAQIETFRRSLEAR